MYPVPSSAMTDETLITAARCGDSRSLEILLARYAPLIGKWSTRPIFHGAVGDARAELTHAFVQAVRRYDSTRGVPPAGYFSACLRYAAQNAGKKILRRRAREVVTDRPVGVDTPATDTPESLCLRRDLRRRLTLALQGLTPRQYAVLTALYYGELSRTETAALLGCTPQAVSDTHRRALSRLRAALDDTNPDY